MALLRCSVCYFLLKPNDLDDDAEVIVKGGFSLCDEHAYISSFEGYHAAIAEANRTVPDESHD